jgi:hypothetical protein
MRKIESRITKIEREIQSQNTIPKSEGFISFSPYETEEEKELKIEKRLEQLRQKYGEDVSREDIVIMRIVYDKPAASGKDELIEQYAHTRGC